MVTLKVSDENIYMKCLDPSTDKLVFTTDEYEAEDWHDEWRAGTRINFLKTHIGLGNIKASEQDKDYVNRLIPVYVDVDRCDE